MCICTASTINNYCVYVNCNCFRKQLVLVCISQFLNELIVTLMLNFLTFTLSPFWTSSIAIISSLCVCMWGGGWWHEWKNLSCLSDLEIGGKLHLTIGLRNVNFFNCYAGYCSWLAHLRTLPSSPVVTSLASVAWSDNSLDRASDVFPWV